MLIKEDHVLPEEILKSCEKGTNTTKSYSAIPIQVDQENSIFIQNDIQYEYCLQSQLTDQEHLFFYQPYGGFHLDNVYNPDTYSQYGDMEENVEITIPEDKSVKKQDKDESKSLSEREVDKKLDEIVIKPNKINRKSKKISKNNKNQEKKKEISTKNLIKNLIDQIITYALKSKDTDDTFKDGISAYRKKIKTILDLRKIWYQLDSFSEKFRKLSIEFIEMHYDRWVYSSQIQQKRYFLRLKWIMKSKCFLNSAEELRSLID